MDDLSAYEQGRSLHYLHWKSALLFGNQDSRLRGFFPRTHIQYLKDVGVQDSALL